MHKFEEGDVTVIIAIENRDDTSDQWVVSKLRDLEELRRLEGATLISINLAEILVELLQLSLREVEVLELLLLLCKLVSHLITFNLKNNL